jgi:hypothetical protein
MTAALSTILRVSVVVLRAAFLSEATVQVQRLGFVLTSEEGQPLLRANDFYRASPQFDSPVMRRTITCELGLVRWMPGRYSVSLFLGDAPEHDSHVVEHAFWFKIAEKDLWGTGQRPHPRPSLFWWPTTVRYSA